MMKPVLFAFCFALSIATIRTLYAEIPLEEKALVFPPALVDFGPASEKPLLAGTGPGNWDKLVRERGWILRENDQWHLWFTGYNEDISKDRLLGYATSSDGLDWKRWPGNPLTQKGWVEDMCILKRSDTYYMFAEGRDDVAHMLTSTDRVNWQEQGDLDIRQVNGQPISVGPRGTPTVWLENDTWWLFYERSDLSVFLATSKDLKVWTNIRDEPVIDRGPSPYDLYAVAVDQIIKHDGHYYAYYHASALPKWGEWSTCIAMSDDLVTWNKYPGNPVIPVNPALPSAGSGTVVHDGKKWRLYTTHPDVRVHFSNRWDLIGHEYHRIGNHSYHWKLIMKMLCVLSILVLALQTSLHAVELSSAKSNIIFILADDLGYGDLGCYGATKIKTPNCDRLASQGLRFTDAHSPSAVCTPTRYAFMTGEYAWRKQGTGILPGIAGLIIEPGRTTVPSLLRRAGYATGVVGKWHLGLGTTPTDYNVEIKPGPLEIGFDYAWLLPSTGDRTPCVWVENHRVVGLDPTDPIQLDYTVNRGEPRSFVNGIPRIGEQKGGKAALWKDDEMADVIAAKAIAFIERQERSKPFFLYMCTHDIHVPRVPHPRFRGTSQAGIRGDEVHSLDWTVGQVMDALDRLKLAENTLIIFTSDNGGVLDTNGPDEVNSGTVATNNGHAHNGALRAGKGSPYEGGTRVPFIVRWPARIKPGTSDALISHVDMLASFAALADQTMSDEDGPDSFNVLPALVGDNTVAPARDHLVEHGRVLALREGTWKLIPTSNAATKKKKQPSVESGFELYNLAIDLGETKNLASDQPNRVKAMSERLEKIRTANRSRP